jgi:hypothetical protein
MFDFGGATSLRKKQGKAAFCGRLAFVVIS